MKIVLYLPTPGGLTGAPRRLLTLSSVLKNHGLSVCIATDKDSDLFKEARRLGFDVLPFDPIGTLRLRGGALFNGGLFFKLKILFFLILQNIKFYKLVKEYQADVLWVRASKGIAFSGIGAALSRRPLIWDIDYELPSKGAIRWLHCFGLNIAHRVVFQYQSAPDCVFGEKLADQYRHKFISLIPGVDLSTLEMHRRKRSQRKKDKYSSFVILQVGTLCDRKNQTLLLDALSVLGSKVGLGRINLKFVGGLTDKDYVKNVQTAIAEKGLGECVEILGWRDDVHALMAHADVLVMPSKDEGVPNTIQEAMYIGLPVIASDVGGIPEIVDDGKTGWVLPLDDPARWASKLLYVMNHFDICKKISCNASDYAYKSFGMDKWGSDYMEVIVDCFKE